MKINSTIRDIVNGHHKVEALIDVSIKNDPLFVLTRLQTIVALGITYSFVIFVDT